MSRPAGPVPGATGQPQVPAGLLERLLAAVRPEFRADELAFALDDPVFGGWAKVAPLHFGDGGIFDQIYQPH